MSGTEISLDSGRPNRLLHPPAGDKVFQLDDIFCLIVAEKLHFFRDNGGDEQVDSTLTVHSIDDRKFLRSLAGCRAYVSTAGFESVCEAMYLGKPMLLVPAHIEQECNAYDAMRGGAVIVAEDFNPDALLQLKGANRRNPDFVRWVDSARSCFLAQLEAALPVRHPRGMALA